MVERKRRASTSSVDSVDDSDIRWRQEASVVRSVPKDVLSDDWPIFELRDAIVLNSDGHTLENALHVGIRGPYIVRGHLIIDDPSQKSHLIMRVRKSVPLEIRKCTSYSIGESPDGSPLIWVSGRGGWYEVNPSPAYRPIYRKMCEATTLYYNMVDIYNSRRAPKKTKKQKQSNLMDELAGVFLQYAARVGDGCTFDEVVARCSEHAGFFICQFAQLENLIDWGPTAFYRWLTSEHADLVRSIEDLIKNPRKLSPVPSAEALSPMPGESASTPLKSSSVEFIDPKDASTGRGSRAASTRVPSAAAKASSEVQPRSAPHQQSPSRTTQPESAAAGDDVSPFESVLRGVEMAYDALVDTKRGLSTTAVLNKIYFAYSFPQYRDGTVGSFKLPVQEVLHYNASALLETLEKRKYENYEFYSYLEQLSTAELRLVAYKPSDFPVKLMPRKRYIRQSKKDIQPASATALPVTVRKAETPDSARLEDVPIAGRGKSLKREGRRTGRKSFLRPVVTNKKRPHSQLESDSETEAQVEAAEVTNSHYFSDGDDTMEDAPDVETPQDGDASDSGQPTPYQEKPVQIVIRAEKIPSTTPQGPDATWTCDQDDCGYVVRGGDDEECQARIREHFVDHEQQVERVSLAVTESRGHLPINHLLEKIKRMGEKSLAPQQTMDGIQVPQPIKRNLIV